MDKINKWINSNLKNYKEKNNITKDVENHLIDWLKKGDDTPKYLRQLEKLSVPDAIELSIHWTSRLIKKASSVEIDGM